MASKFEQEYEECRGRVCVCCYHKGDRPISSKEIKCINQYLIEGYSTKNPEFPNALCTGCHIELSKKISDSEYQLLPKVQDYDAGRSKHLRSATSSCACKICSVAKMTGLAYNRMVKKKKGRPKSNASKCYKICGNCFQQIYQGSNHSSSKCRYSRRDKVSHIEKLVNTPTTLQRVASRVVKRQSDTPLATLGPKKRRISEEPVKSGPLFDSEQILGIQTDLGLSNTQTRVLAQDIRMATGSRKALERGFSKEVTANSHKLDGYFEEIKINYTRINKESKVSENFEQVTVVCNDLSKLVDLVVKERSLEDAKSLLVKIGMDGGGGFLKLCLGVFDIDNLVSKKSGISKKFKDSGVKKIFLVATVPNVPENYENVKKLWMNLGLNNFDRKFTIATDLKLCNILVGLMTHSSCHPCCWCDVEKSNLKNKGTRRTIASLNKLFWDYFNANVDKSEAKRYGNVIHPPIMSESLDDDTPVMKILPPPELHLLIGPVNTLYTGLEKVWPESEVWLKACNVKKVEYHGGQFEGNDSRALLLKVDQLSSLSPKNNTNVNKFVSAFKALNDVVTACYGYKLHRGYKTKIQKFTRAYLALGINVTPKVHAVMHHVGEFCAMTGRGLGPWSEQASESIHHDFKQTWNRFKVIKTDHERYGEHLLNAVRAYNSHHI